MIQKWVQILVKILFLNIQDICLETGLSKGSLGIISQGAVSWFTDAGPEDRRKVFEDAAGIGGHTKQKDESIRQLDRAHNNFNRVSDLTKELARDLKKLESQAEKVKNIQNWKKN